MKMSRKVLCDTRGRGAGRREAERGGLTWLTLLSTRRAEFNEARRRFANAILDAEDVPACMEAFLFGRGIDSDQRANALLFALEWPVKADLKHEEFWCVFGNTWSACDRTWHHRRDLLKWLRRYSPPILSDDGRAFLDRLRKPVQVYRGCSRQRVRGISWTADPKVAEEFARGHRGIGVPDPVIASAVIPATAVFAVLVDRDESEIVLDPRRLAKLTIRPTNPVKPIRQRQ
jgi:hypothetical protein